MARVRSQRIGRVAIGNRDVVDPDMRRTRNSDAIHVGVARVFRVHIPRGIDGQIAQNHIARPGREGFFTLALRHPGLEVGLRVAAGSQGFFNADQDLCASDASRAALRVIDANEGGVGRNLQRAAFFLVVKAGVFLEYPVVPAEVDVANHADDLRFIAGRADRGEQLLFIEYGVNPVAGGRRSTSDQDFALARPAVPAIHRRGFTLECELAAGRIDRGELPSRQLRRGLVV